MSGSTGQIVGGVVGAVVGFFVGDSYDGAALGWSIGPCIGGQVDVPLLADGVSPKLETPQNRLMEILAEPQE